MLSNGQNELKDGVFFSNLLSCLKTAIREKIKSSLSIQCSLLYYLAQNMTTYFLLGTYFVFTRGKVFLGISFLGSMA